MKFMIHKGDITTFAVDAIVNAANPGLRGGGGVDGAIHRAGGPVILEECERIVARTGSCGAGEAVHTTAGRLPARYVIHTVGPVWQGGDRQEPELLYACYAASLELAAGLGCRTIAYPNISTGVYGFPKEQAVRVVYDFALDAMRRREFDAVLAIHFVCFDDENLGLYRRAFGAVAGLA
jgi:O-acetyl-ADP-ribose deacetylase